jgi:hypothetical protein
VPAYAPVGAPTEAPLPQPHAPQATATLPGYIPLASKATPCHNDGRKENAMLEIFRFYVISTRPFEAVRADSAKPPLTDSAEIRTNNQETAEVNS